MELNVKEQTEKLQAEINDLAAQVQQADTEINKFTQIKSDLLKEGLKKVGALELLQGLNGDKPKEGMK